jgi:hypothetical protein
MKLSKIFVTIIFGCLSGAVFVLEVSKASSAQTAVSDLQVWIEPRSAEVLPLEPLLITVHLKNAIGQPVKLTQSWEVFRYVYSKSGEWDIYYPENGLKFLSSPPMARVFRPDEVQTWLTFFDFNAHAIGAHVFAQPGTYWLKVGIGQLESAPVPITVVDPHGEDLAAYEMLSQKDLAHYFAHEFFNRYSYDEQTVASLEKFIRDFPGSRYREHAQLASALMWLQEVGGKTDLPKAKELLTDLSKKASGNMAARSHYYLGIIDQNEGKMDSARQYFGRVIQGGSDPYFTYLAKKALAAMTGL